MAPQVAFRSHPDPHASSENLLPVEDLCGAAIEIHDTDKMALCTTASIGDLLPEPIRRNIATPIIPKPLVGFGILNV